MVLKMTKKIFKYQLDIKDEQILEMPKDAEILTVQNQRGWLCLWARVDPNFPKENRKIRVIGTGHPLYDKSYLKYIGSAQFDNGYLVWHVFEEIK